MSRSYIGHLEQQTIANYQAAINYYTQKKISFLQKLAQKSELAEKEVEQKLVDKFNNDLNNGWNSIYNIVKRVTIVGGRDSGFKYSIKENANLEGLPLELRERLIKGQNSLNLYSLMGFEKEKYYVEPINNIMQEIGGAAIADVMGAFELTGGMTSKSAMRGDGLSIRADLAIGLEKSGGVVKEKGGTLTAELQEEFSLEKVVKASGGANNIKVNDIIASYIKSGMFGVSVKLWSASSGKTFTQISGVKDKLNTIFNSSGDKTWNLKYAAATTNKIVSNYLLDIVGPINIALLDGKGLTWTDDFISSHLFTMNTHAKNNEIYPNNEAHPEIRDSNVVLRNFNMGRAGLQNIISDSYRSKLSSKSYRIVYRLERVK